MTSRKTMTLRNACNAAIIDKSVLWKNEDKDCVSCAGSICDALEKHATWTLERYKGLCLGCLKTKENTGWSQREIYEPEDLWYNCTHTR